MTDQPRLQPPNWIALEMGKPSRCPYLPPRKMQLAAGLSLLNDPHQFDRLMSRGYRRAGLVFYRPQCPGGCRECRPIRVPIARFTPSRSQRRVSRRFGHEIEAHVGRPRSSEQHLEVHNRHAELVSPRNKACSPDEYRLSFVETCVNTYQIDYRIGGALVGVSTVDIGATTGSSVYFSWHPDYARYSLGTFSALWEIDWLADLGVEYYHLGYWVAGCASMSYKSRFKPFELLDWQSGRWLEAPPEAGC